jgi:hypothetical protein
MNPHRVLIACLALAAALLPGCSGSRRMSPADPSRAREALTATLDCWKRGESPASLTAAAPPIAAQDLDWLAGAKLESYEVAGEGKTLDAYLRFPVKLSLQTRDGQKAEKAVNYLVGTSPSLVVYRDFR